MVNKILIAILLASSMYANKINNSVVKIFTTSSKVNYKVPWQLKNSKHYTGSGVLIKDNYILTSAHVVSDATYIEIKKQNTIQKYEAKIKWIAHDIDLALLVVNDKSFYKDMKPLKIVKLPYRQDDVTVVGYPKGGKNISTTKGIISRLELHEYVHSRKKFLTIQIDAPINSGNSGGPAFNNKNEIVGIAMQTLKKSSNIGYIVPSVIINHFLEDIKDGKYDGMIDDAFLLQRMFNRDFREYYKMKDRTGVYVSEVYKGSYAYNILKEGDIILKYEDKIIENDGSVKFRNSRISADYFLNKKQIGDNLTFTILRDNKVLNKTIKIKHRQILIPEYFDKKTEYLIFAGFVIMPLSKNYIVNEEYRVNSSWLNTLYSKNDVDNNITQYVFIHDILASKINSGYSNQRKLRILKVNGIIIKNFKHLVSLIDNIKDKYIVFDMEYNAKIVLNFKNAKEENKGILEMYNIPYDRYLDNSTIPIR